MLDTKFGNDKVLQDRDMIIMVKRFEINYELPLVRVLLSKIIL